MATTITQKPNLLMAVNTPLIYILSESASGTYNGFKFRYVLKVEIDGTEIAVIKIHKNQSNVGIFDISKILKTYLETEDINSNSSDYSIHSLGVLQTAKPFGVNSKQCIEVEANAYYEVAADATSAPELSALQASADNFAIPATTPFTKTVDNTGGLDINGTNFPLTYFMNSDSVYAAFYSFFTNAPTVQFVRGGNASLDNVDLLTICFKQGDSGSASMLTDGDKLEYIFIEYFNSSGVAIAGTVGSATWYAIPNSTTSGGSTAAQATTTSKSILYFGCGTKNLQSQVTADVIDSEAATVSGTNARPSNHTDWAYYRIYGSSTAATSGQCTKYYYFYRYGSGAKVDDRHQSCTRHNNIRLAWVNRLGGWDYMNFRGKSVESVEIKRSEMSNVPGTWDASTFNYNNWDGGKKTLFTEANRMLVINSDWLNEDEAVWLEELFTSTQIQILDNYYAILYPVLLREKTYTKKTSLNNKIKIQYKMKLEYANNVRTNS